MPPGRPGRGAAAAEELTRIKDADVLLVPVGGNCTINATQAAEVVAQVEPKLIVPMHYATEETRGHLRARRHRALLQRARRERSHPARAPEHHAVVAAQRADGGAPGEITSTLKPAG